jgi:hypothetical protein
MGGSTAVFYMPRLDRGVESKEANRAREIRTHSVQRSCSGSRTGTVIFQLAHTHGLNVT